MILRCQVIFFLVFHVQGGSDACASTVELDILFAIACMGVGTILIATAITVAFREGQNSTTKVLFSRPLSTDGSWFALRPLLGSDVDCIFGRSISQKCKCRDEVGA
jgi:hypothetical protein